MCLCVVIWGYMHMDKLSRNRHRCNIGLIYNKDEGWEMGPG